jgi:hypothetical protein
LGSGREAASRQAQTIALSGSPGADEARETGHAIQAESKFSQTSQIGPSRRKGNPRKGPGFRGDKGGVPVPILEKLALIFFSMNF